MPRYARNNRPQSQRKSPDKHDSRPDNTFSNTKLLLLVLLCGLVAFVHDRHQKHPQLFKELQKGNFAILWEHTKDSLSPDRVSHPMEDYAAEIQGYFKEEKFSVLEQLVAQLRSGHERLPGGGWKLAAYYQGLRPAPGAKDQTTQWQTNLNRLGKWRQQFPDSATPLIAMVDNFTQFAEPIKSQAELNQLPAGRRKQFNEAASLGEQALNEINAAQTKDPHLYAALLELGRLSGWNAAKFEQLYQQGVGVEPAYQHIHQAKAAYLLPQWFGQPGESEEVAQTAADKLGGPAGQQLYYQIAADVYTRTPGKVRDQLRFSLGGIKEGFQSLDRAFGVDTQSLNKGAWLLACNGDLAGAKPLFERIGANYDPAIWRSKTDFETMQANAAQYGASGLGQSGNFKAILMGVYILSLFLVRTYLGAAAGPLTTMLTGATLFGVTQDTPLGQEQFMEVMNWVKDQINGLSEIIGRGSRSA